MDLRVFLSGEGPNDLAVAEALLSKVRPGGWIIRERILWKEVPKLRVKVADAGDAATVAKLLLRAREAGCHVLAFVRDRDGQHAREKVIERAIQEAPSKPTMIVGGVAIELLECWLLALRGLEGSETTADAGAHLERLGCPAKATGPMKNLVLHAHLDEIPGDARSLRLWLRRAADGLRVPLPKFLKEAR